MPYFKQIPHEATGCLSYIVGCPTKGVCVVVDALEDTETYTRIAADEGMKITSVIDTHVHADHISGGRKLASELDVDFSLFKSANVKFDFQPLRDGQGFRVGDRRFRVIHTPGHTPESMSLLIDGRWVLTGDTLFVGSVGRMDLYGAGTPDQHYNSLFKRLMKLDDYVEAFPAHYGRSACGKGLGPLTTTTIGYERRYNPFLKTRTKTAFISAIKRGVPKPPENYFAIKKRNLGEE